MRNMIVNAAKKAVSGIKSLARKVTNAVVKAAVSFKDFIKSIIGKAKSLFKGKTKDGEEATVTVTDLSNPQKRWKVIMETKAAEREARSTAFDRFQKEKTENGSRPRSVKKNPNPTVRTRKRKGAVRKSMNPNQANPKRT